MFKKAVESQPEQSKPAKEKTSVTVELTKDELYFTIAALGLLASQLEADAFEAVKYRGLQYRALATRLDAKWQEFPRAYVCEVKTAWFMADDKQRSQPETGKAE